jgi:hypothetical protein
MCTWGIDIATQHPIPAIPKSQTNDRVETGNPAKRALDN